MRTNGATTRAAEGSYIEQELFTTTPTMSVTAKVGDVTKTRNYPGVPGTGGWEFAENTRLSCVNAETGCDGCGRDVHCETVRRRADCVISLLSPSHAMLTIHEIVCARNRARSHYGVRGELRGHELCETVRRGQAANMAANCSTSRLTRPVLASAQLAMTMMVCKTKKWPLIRDGILVGFAPPIAKPRI